jgi:hypothetical protein
MQKRSGDPATGRTNPTTSSINHAFQRTDINLTLIEESADATGIFALKIED